MSRNVRLAANSVSRLAASRASVAQVRAVSNAASNAASNAESSSAAANAQRTTHFGFQTVAEEEKEGLGAYRVWEYQDLVANSCVPVGGVFSSVASKYDIMNDSMSLGIHRLWKDDFVATMLPRLPPSVHRNPVRNGVAVPDGEAPAPAPFKCLDVAGGTGDIALRLLDRARDKFGSRDIEVEVVDLTENMLHEGRKRVAQTMYYNSELGTTTPNS
jgi:2-methoxy-6-polyprenyl-1,4-benzoquinol methylase